MADVTVAAGGGAKETEAAGSPWAAFQPNVYKQGQGTPVRLTVFAAFALLWFSGCRWLYLLPGTASSWYKPVMPTGGTLLALAAVIAAGIALYRIVVRGRTDRPLLRWGAMTGGWVLAAVLVKWLLLGQALASVEALAKPLLSKPLPMKWGHVASALAYLYGLWAVFCLVVNHPQRVDFLIETETELRKVAWPVRREYVGASFVVIIIVALVSLYLTGVDLLLTQLMIWLGIGF